MLRLLQQSSGVALFCSRLKKVLRWARNGCCWFPPNLFQETVCMCKNLLREQRMEESTSLHVWSRHFTLQVSQHCVKFTFIVTKDRLNCLQGVGLYRFFFLSLSQGLWSDKTEQNDVYQSLRKCSRVGVPAFLFVYATMMDTKEGPEVCNNVWKDDEGQVSTSHPHHASG